MWETVNSQDEDNSIRPSVNLFKCVVKMVNGPQQHDARQTSDTQQHHEDLKLLPHRQPLASFKSVAASVFEKIASPDIPEVMPRSTERHEDKVHQENRPLDDSAVKGNSSLPASPKGVEDFDIGVVKFDDDFSSENNPFRAAQAESSSVSPGGWDHVMITGDPPARGRAGPLSGREESGAEEVISRRTKAPTQHETAARLFQISTDATDATTADSVQAEVPLIKTSSRILSDLTVGIPEKISSKMRMYIDNYESGFFRSLMYQLIFQPKITKLDIYRSCPGARTSPDMELFFRMVRSLPNLRILSLSNMHGESDTKYFDEALSKHASVTHITLKLASGDITPNTIRTLQSMPRLLEVRLDSNQSFDASPLLGSLTLRRLHIGSNSSYSFDNSHIMSMIPLLECSATLVELDLEPSMSILALKFLVRALRSNRSIQVLQVATDLTASQALIHQAMSEMATVLTMNSTLRVLNNINYSKLEVEASCSRWILRGLEANVTIEHFQLFREDPSFSNRKRELVKPSARNFNKRIGDGSMNASFANPRSSSPSACDSSVPGSEASNTTSATTTIFCSVFDTTNLEPMARASKNFLKNAREHGDRALSYVALGFATKSEKARPSVA